MKIAADSQDIAVREVFPTQTNPASDTYNTVMDLRDYFAAQAIKSHNWTSDPDYKEKRDYENSTRCYEIADAMMRARQE